MAEAKETAAAEELGILLAMEEKEKHRIHDPLDYWLERVDRVGPSLKTQ